MKKRKQLFVLFVIVLLSILSAAGYGKSSIKVWTVDCLTKVFRDDKPKTSDKPAAEVARGETASLQIALRCSEKIEELKACLEPLTLDKDKNCKLEKIKVRFVGYIYIRNYVKNPASDRLRKEPADFPDVLLDDKSINLEPNLTQPIWITISVPTEAKAGLYKGEVKITGKINNKLMTRKIPVSIKVYDVVVGKSRLWLTNWFGMDYYRSQSSIDAKLSKLTPYSPLYWDIMRKYARNMAEHRQNMANLSPLKLTEYSIGNDGKIKFDFTRFNRAVQIFVDEGVIGRIEGSHIGGRIKDKWEKQFEIYIYKIKDGKIVRAGADPCSAKAYDFYSQFLPALVENLKQKGWLDKYVQHIADEPIPGNLPSYAAIVQLVRNFAPQFKIIEATHTKKLTGLVDICVPQLNFLKHDYELYKQWQGAGKEIWFYTCVNPQDEFANRFIELPLWKTRILHWINFQYGITGYLHWGYNQWNSIPFKKIAMTPDDLPAGDEWIVYPGIDGPLDSIRFEAMRDGAADYELLSMLAEFDPVAAKSFSSRHIKAMDKYNFSVKSFRQTRRELLKLLSKSKSSRP